MSFFYDIVNEDVPELVLCLASPPYFAVIVKEPVFGGAVYVALQLLWLELIATKVQVLLTKLPPERLALHDIIPVGALFVPPLVSVTVV